MISSQELGLKGGINTSRTESDIDIGGADFRTRIFGGIYYRFKLIDRFSIMTELIYSTQGGQSISDINELCIQCDPFYPDGKITSTLTEDYIAIPISFEYSILNNLKSAIGFSIAKPIKRSLMREFDFDESSIPEDFNFSNSSSGELKKDTSEVLLFIGATYELIKNLSFTIRYYYGLGIQIPNSPSTITGNSRLFQLSLDYTIHNFKP